MHCLGQTVQLYNSPAHTWPWDPCRKFSFSGSTIVFFLFLLFFYALLIFTPLCLIHPTLSCLSAAACPASYHDPWWLLSVVLPQIICPLVGSSASHQHSSRLPVQESPEPCPALLDESPTPSWPSYSRVCVCVHTPGQICFNSTSWAQSEALIPVWFLGFLLCFPLNLFCATSAFGNSTDSGCSSVFSFLFELLPVKSSTHNLLSLH